MKGSNPNVGSAPAKKSVNYSGYVIPSDGVLIMTKPPWFNYETVIQSLRDFIQAYPVEEKRLYVVIDNAPRHKKAYRPIEKERQKEYADIREKVTLINLPPYSPDLNPIEQVWRETRREVTHKTYFENVVLLERALDNHFDALRVPNDKIASLCSFKYESLCFYYNYCMYN